MYNIDNNECWLLYQLIFSTLFSTTKKNYEKCPIKNITASTTTSQNKYMLLFIYLFFDRNFVISHNILKRNNFVNNNVYGLKHTKHYHQGDCRSSQISLGLTQFDMVSASHAKTLRSIDLPNLNYYYSIFLTQFN